MSVIINGDTGITSTGGYAGDGISFADNTPSNTLVTTTGGNVGVGTASPKGTLDVTSSGAYVPVLLSTTNVASASQRNWMISTSWNSVGDLSFVTSNAQGGNPVSAGTTRMMIDPSGNVGIGTSSPSYRIDATSTDGIFRFTKSGGASGYFLMGGTSANLSYDTSGNYAWSVSSNDVGAYTAGVKRMAIDANGNLLVGATATINLAKMLMSFTNASNGFYLDETSNSSGTQYVRFSQSGTTTGSITRVSTTSAVTYNTTSDYRLKNVIGVVSGSGERIDALEPIDFSWKADGSVTKGFLAHKFQEVYPQSVTGTKDAVDADGNPEYQAMQAGSAEVIADLVAEIQSLRKRLTALEQLKGNQA